MQISDFFPCDMIVIICHSLSSQLRPIKTYDPSYITWKKVARLHWALYTRLDTPIPKALTKLFILLSRQKSRWWIRKGLVLRMYNATYQ